MQREKILYVFISFIYGIIAISCHFQCKENVEFKKFYFKKIDEIINYDKNMSKEGYTFTDAYWLSFYETSEYLEALTKHEFRYITGEPPLYIDITDLTADIRDLKKWYKANKCGMTIQKADSIVKERYNEMTAM
jgi:hypothetical protein